MKLIACTSYNKRFAWESYCFLNNLTEKGYKDILLLVYINPKDELANNSKYLWDKMQGDFPEVEFFFWEDNENFIHLTQVFGYIPLIRPKILLEYWKLHPEMEKIPFFYVDTDILFYKPIDFSKFLKDEIIYISEAKGYTNSTYFLSKYEFSIDENGIEHPKFIQPAKWQAFKNRDFLDEFSKSVGISREIVESNKDNSGAAQYLLKNIDEKFWEDVLNSCMVIKIGIHNANQEYFIGNNYQEKEDNGWQAWCADIWALTWNLLKRNREIVTPPELNFTWASNDRSNLEIAPIYHNAGITSDDKIKRKKGKEEIECPVFYKASFEYISDSKTPFDNHIKLKEVIEHPVSSTIAISYYCEELLKTKYKYNL